MKTLILFVLAFTLAPQVARAETDAQYRCWSEVQSLPSPSSPANGIQSHHARARHAWAARCKYITSDEALKGEALGMVWTFTNLAGASPNAAPWEENAPCGHWKRFVLCPLGCFASDQKILFGNEYLNLEEARAGNLTTFTSLAPSSSVLAPVLQTGKKLSYLTVGDESEALIEVRLQDEKKVVVTQHHPMIDAMGTIISAKSIKAGNSVMTVDGPRSVLSVKAIDGNHKVWHVRPESDKPLDNVIIANGVLTGSARYQNEWADRVGRLSIRDFLDEDTVDAFTYPQR